MKKGGALELRIAREVHQNTLPVLISQVVLRKWNAGQVDLAYIFKNKLFIIEVKASRYPRSLQIKRLKRSLDFLTAVLKCEGMLLTYNAKKNHLTSL